MSVSDPDASDDAPDDGGPDTGDESSREEGYVHRPGGEPPSDTIDPTFDWRGWLLVGTLVVAFVVVPGALLLLARAQSAVAAVGLTPRDAYLVLPLIPALLLGFVAVWSAVNARSR